MPVSYGWLGSREEKKFKIENIEIVNESDEMIGEQPIWITLLLRI